MEKIALINGLRGIAIAAVVFHHSFFILFLYGIEQDGLPARLLATFASSGWLGVNLFFLLSGFVLYAPYVRGDRAMLGLADAASFYRRRFLRLMPLYWFVSLVSLVFFARIPFSDPEFTRWLLLLGTATFQFAPSTFMPAPNWVLWSLGVEIVFSLAFPLLVVAVQRLGWPAMLAGVVSAALVTRLLGHTVLPAAPDQILNVISDSALGRLDDFVAGMVLAHVTLRGSWRIRGVGALAGLAAIGLAMILWGAWYRREIPTWTAAFLSWPLDAGALALIAYLLQLPQGAGRLVWRTVEAWPVQMLGLMCYSIYVWHGVLLFAMEAWAGSLPRYLSYLVVLALVSAVSYRYIEFPHVRDSKRLLPSKTARRQVLA